MPPSTKRCPPRCSRPRCMRALPRAARRISRTGSCRRCASGSAATTKSRPAGERSRATERTMNELHSDALVFFGATGDLAYKKVFPALLAMHRRGHLDVPVIGVAKSGWNLDRLQARARDSVERHGAFDAA